MGRFWGHWVTIKGNPVYIEIKGARPMVGVAAALVFSAVAGSGAAGAASASAAADAFSIGARISRSQAEVRVRGANDSLRATSRLRRMGGHPTTLDTKYDKNCADHSNGDIQFLFREHPCVSLHRTLIEYREGNYVVRFLIATIEMPDYETAKDLQKLLVQQGGGGITPPSPERGKYRHIPFTDAHRHTTLHDTTVIATQVQPVGRTPRADVLASLAREVLFTLG